MQMHEAQSLYELTGTAVEESYTEKYRGCIDWPPSENANCLRNVYIRKVKTKLLIYILGLSQQFIFEVVVAV